MLNQIWSLSLIRPVSTIKTGILNARNRAIVRMADWTVQNLLPAMTYGGLGIQGISETSFYRFITSDDGLSQLGIRPQDPHDLLRAYIDSFEVKAQNGLLIFRFGNEAELKLGTPHWATGTGKLKVDSWLDWILDGEKVDDAGYIPRNEIPQKLQGNIRLNDPLGGLMLPQGALKKSTGHWEFPTMFKEYSIEWLKQNATVIENVIVSAFVGILESELH